MRQDLGRAVGGYRGLVEALAEKVARTPQAKRVGAEYDDLVQEGLINVWETLSKGLTPKATIVEGRMKNWIRHLAGGGDYGALLPIELATNLSREQDTAVGREP